MDSEKNSLPVDYAPALSEKARRLMMTDNWSDMVILRGRLFVSERLAEIADNTVQDETPAVILAMDKMLRALNHLEYTLRKKKDIDRNPLIEAIDRFSAKTKRMKQYLAVSFGEWLLEAEDQRGADFPRRYSHPAANLPGLLVWAGLGHSDMDLDDLERLWTRYCLQGPWKKEAYDMPVPWGKQDIEDVSALMEQIEMLSENARDVIDDDVAEEN